MLDTKMCYFVASIKEILNFKNNNTYNAPAADLLLPGTEESSAED